MRALAARVFRPRHRVELRPPALHWQHPVPGSTFPFFNPSRRAFFRTPPPASFVARQLRGAAPASARRGIDPRVCRPAPKAFCFVCVRCFFRFVPTHPLSPLCTCGPLRPAEGKPRAAAAAAAVELCSHCSLGPNKIAGSLQAVVFSADP